MKSRSALDVHLDVDCRYKNVSVVSPPSFAVLLSISLSTRTWCTSCVISAERLPPCARIAPVSFMMSSNTLLAAYLALCLLAVRTHGYQFEIEGSARRCFEEEIPLSTKVVVTYTALQGSGEAPMSLKITNMHGAELYNRDHIMSGSFVFTTADTMPGLSKEDSWSMKDEDAVDEKFLKAVPEGAGDNRLVHKLCFEQRLTGMHLPHLSASKDPVRRVIFDVKFGADSKTKEDYDQLAKEKHLSNTEEMFKAVEDLVSDVVKDIDEMRQRERRMDLLNRKTQNLVLWYSAFACFCVLGGALYSSYATRTFLSREKII